MRYGGSIRAYQAGEHELADLLADVDAEDVLVYMPHTDDTGDIRRLAEAWERGTGLAQEEGLTSWEN